MVAGLGGLIGEELESPRQDQAQEHPLPWTHPRSQTLLTWPNSQWDLARLFGAEAGEETWPALPRGAGGDGRLPAACLCPCPVLMSELHNEKLLYFVNRVRHPSPPLHARYGLPAEPRLPPSLSSAAFCNVLMGFLAWVCADLITKLQ